MMLSTDQLRREEAKFVLSIMVIYLVLWFFMPKPAFWGIDNGIKFQGAESFAKTGSIRIPYEGLEFDPKGKYRPIPLPFASLHHETQLPAFPVTFMVLSGIFLFLFGKSGMFLLPLLGGWAAVVAAWHMWIRHRENHDGRLFLVLFGFGSPLIFYSLTLWEHTWSIAFVTLSMTILSRGRKGLRKPHVLEALAAGFLIAVATAFRSESILWAPIILLFWGFTNRSPRAAGRYLLGFGVGLGLLAGINEWQTQSILPLHIHTNLIVRPMHSIFEMLVTRAQNFYLTLFEGFRANHWSLIGLLPLLVVPFWRRWRREEGWWVVLFVGIMVAQIIYLFVSSQAKNPAGYMLVSGGLFWTCPVAVLALVRFRGERRRFWRLVHVSALVYTLIIVLFTPGMHGVHWGPRFILQVMPFMLILAATRAQRWWHNYKLSRPIIMLLILVSLVTQSYSIKVLFTTKQANRNYNEWIATTGDMPVLASAWWLPGDASLHSRTNPWFITDRMDKLQEVVKGLSENGTEQVKFLEMPEYVDDEIWRSHGLEPLGQDYLVGGGKNYPKLRRAWLRISSPGQEPRERE